MKKKNLFLLIFLSLVLLMTGCGKNDSSRGSFKAGEYEVTEASYGGDIKLKVTMSDFAIEKIEVLENSETDGIGSVALEQIPAKIVEGQSLDVESISGATATSTAIFTAIEKALKDAGGDKSMLKAKKVSKAEPVEKEVDVVVVGGGGAGLSAAISAAQNGAKVLLVEKAPALGGNTVRAGGPYNAADPERQKSLPPADDAAMEKIMALTTKEAKSEEHKKLMETLKAELDEYNKGPKDHLFDSVTLHKLQTYDGGDYAGKLEFIEKLADEALPTSVWMEKNGVQWKNEITTVPGGLWPRAHLPINSAGQDYILAGKNAAEKAGVEILLNSPAEELIIENGKVTGIKGSSEGAPMTVKAKAVVLATGGFAGNKEMRQIYNKALIDSLPTTNAPSVTGDGIKMGEAAGANTIGMEFIQCLPLGNPENGSLNGWIGGSGVENYYQINKEGKRFMAEDGRRDEMTAALLAQTDAFSYVISCGNNELEVNDKGENIWGNKIDELVEKKIIFRADTIEDLAKQLGIDPAVLKETNDKFNSYVKSGKDADFGRTLFGKPMDKAPFFASPRVPTVHHTMGGLEIDLTCHVLDKDGKTIPGLLAAGEVTGGIHGKNRLGGNALVDIHVFGRIAGETAAKEAK
ncbi:flavocytochrome c [Clostridiales bacterium KA00134]|nr:flavocytochrome c [Clostridiales bacterium KA00134]